MLTAKTLAHAVYKIHRFESIESTLRLYVAKVAHLIGSSVECFQNGYVRMRMLELVPQNLYEA